MKDALIADGREAVSKKKVRVKVIKESGFAAGLAALNNLDGLDIATRPVSLTARMLVQEGIETIVKLRAKNVPLLRIYSDLKKASGMKISFETFAGYVSEAAKKAGLRFEKAKTVPSMPASTTAGAAPVPAQALERDEIMLAGEQSTSWNCDNCLTDSQRRESTKSPGRYFWRCSSCGQCYADDAGVMTDQKL